ncbi:MAG: hypothetical protein ACREWE_06920, partial [Gammaproteobacteria bacterium]
ICTGSLHAQRSVTAQRVARRDSLGRVGGMSDLLVFRWIQDATPLARHYRTTGIESQAAEIAKAGADGRWGAAPTGPNYLGASGACARRKDNRLLRLATSKDWMNTGASSSPYSWRSKLSMSRA